MNDILVYVLFTFVVIMSIFIWAWRQESKQR